MGLEDDEGFVLRDTRFRLARAGDGQKTIIARTGSRLIVRSGTGRLPRATQKTVIYARTIDHTALVTRVIEHKNRVVKRGIAGNPGPPGPVGSDRQVEEWYMISSPGEQQINLQHMPVNLFWRINGLENRTAFLTVDDSLVTIPSMMGLEVGDWVSFFYIW